MSDGAPTFLSLFSGVGGFDYALERAGFRCVGQVENDPFCVRVLERRWPVVARWGDIRTLDVSAFVSASGGGTPRYDERGRIDLLVGGFPCQDLSVAGKRAGLGGERSGLFWEIVRIAKIVKPRWACLENVPGLLSSSGGRDMGLVLAGLRECWPAVGYRVLDSQHVGGCSMHGRGGVPQRRRRVFFVCGPDEARVAAVLFEPEGGGGNPAAGGEAGARVAASTVLRAHKASEDDVNLVAGTWWDGGDVSETLDAAGPGQRMPDKGRFRAVPVGAIAARYGKGTDSDATDPMVVGALGCDKERGGWRAGPDEAAAGQLIVGGGDDALGVDGEDQVEADGAGGSVGVGATGRRDTVQAVGSEPAGDAGLRDPGRADGRDGEQLLLALVPQPRVDPVHAPVLVGGEAPAQPGAGPAGGAAAAGDGLAGPDVVGPRAPAAVHGEAVAFNWQSGGDCRLGAKEGRTDAIHANQVPAVAYQCQGSNVGPAGSLRGLTSGVPFVTHPLKAEGHDGSEDGTGRGGAPLVWAIQEIDGRQSKDQNGLGIGIAGETMYTLQAGHQHGVGTPMTVRRLTPTECARLQAFPDGWCCACQPLDVWADDPETVAERCVCADAPQYRAYGNAVTTSVVSWLGLRIKAAMDGP